METLSGSVERITYYNPENGYSVVRLQPDRGKIPDSIRGLSVTAVGNLPKLAPGEYLSLQGQWVKHPRHGLQFQIEICEQSYPASIGGIRRYLGSGLVKGIGPRLAERIVDQFGSSTLDVIENEPHRLMEVPDIGPIRGQRITQAWEAQKQVKHIMLFLHSHQVSTNLSIKIYKQYGENSLHVVQNDPYRLAQDIRGVGFKTADHMAQRIGLPKDHPSRIEAGISYVLNQATNDGHVFLPRHDLVDKSSSLLDVSPDLIPPALQNLSRTERIHQESLPGKHTNDEFKSEGSPSYVSSAALSAIYLTPLYLSELGTAEGLRTLSSAIPSKLSDIPPAFTPLDPSLSFEQHDAVRSALQHPLSVLTGGPGTGKTTTIRALITVLESANKKYALASPTGRAAKRLSQATGRPASTIHRLLGFKPGEGFRHNAENPLQIDILVVDETSMLDLVLANSLLKALSPGTHLVLVGDYDQLPSVGAGDVLRDLIASGTAPVTRLSLIFRQASDSHIISNAHRINQGQMPVFPSIGSKSDAAPEDFFLFPSQTPEETAEWVVDIVCNRIPMKFGLHPQHDIQVLVPMYRGPVGVNALNELLQAAINPSKKGKSEKSLFGQIVREGDKLMQIQNNYEKVVFNGDIGSLLEIDTTEQSLTVNFEGRSVVYDWSEADQLVLAYAVSVHKGQGSEFPAVVIPMVTHHYIMLQRNLLYTAVTRAQKLCVLVGSRRAIGIAVNNNKIARRYTALDWRLKGG